MAVLSGVAAPVHALTLGDLRGTAVIGKALDVSVPVMLGSGEEALASCLSVEVLFADVPQLNTSVMVSPVASGAVSTALVRIRSGSAVNEPVVSVQLRSTCGAVSSSRRFVLLSDFPAPDLPRVDGASGANVVTHAFAPLKAPQSGTDAAATSSTAAPGSQEAVPAKAAASAVVAAKPKPRPVVKKRVMSAKPLSAPDAAAKPVLKLDTQSPLPVAAETPAAPAVPASAPASAPSEEAVRQAQLIESLQNDVKALKELAVKNQATVTEFQAKLRQAESERVPMTWFYLVVGLLGASLAALFWVLRKQQNTQQRDWWQQAQKDTPETLVINSTSAVQHSAPMSDFGKFVNQAAVSVAPVATVVPSTQIVPEPEPEPIPEPENDLDIDLDSLAPGTEPPASPESLAVEPVDGFGAGHNINLETISDIRQQAEFFVSLGQTDRALNILRRQIMESTEPNPLVYLDLLTLYHAEGLRTDFRELRVAFRQFFNVSVPDFAVFNQEGRDLLAYTEPLAVLTRFWPNIEAIAFLEACIFHNNAAPMQMAFDLAAFRDLLMLHAVAEKVTSDSPWKMTSHGGLDTSSAAAEMAELAMTMRGQFDGDKVEPIELEMTEAKAGSELTLPVSVSSPRDQGLDLELDLDLDAFAPKQPPRDSGPV